MKTLGEIGMEQTSTDTLKVILTGHCKLGAELPGADQVDETAAINERQRQKRRQNVRDELALGQRKEDDDHRGPDDEEAFIRVPPGAAAAQSPGQEPGPGQQ